MAYEQSYATKMQDQSTAGKIKSEDKPLFEGTDTDTFFAKERYKLHLTTPNEGVYVEALKKYFSKKYGF